jgi:hypothetical protein
MSEPHSGNPDPFTSIFDGVDIISQYSDSEALADGLLVDIHHLRLRFRGYAVDRMTDNFNGFLTNIWQQYNDRGGEDTIFSELDQKLMLTELIGHAVNEDPSDPFPRIWTIHLNRIDRKVWLVRNERHNWTIMFPEDY